MANIDNLSIQISSSADSAAKGIDTLVTQLGKLKSAVSTSGDGLDRLTHQLTEIGNAGRGMSNNIAQKLTNLANGLKALQSVGKVTISSTIGKGIESINQALNSLNVNNLPKIERFANALKALSGMGDIRISSTIAKEMTNIGAAAELLKDVDFTGVKNLADALKQFQGMQDVKIPKISGGAAAEAADAAGAADVVEDTMDSVPPSAEEAENSTRSFGDALKGLAQKLNGAIGPVNGFKGTVKGLWGVLKGAVGGVLGFVGGIARIAKYRFIRALIKDLVQSFKDLYGYSDKFGTGFADAMDKITTSTTYFRNSLAAMTAPLLEILAPALDFVIDKIVWLMNQINQLFAALSGASTYTAARKVERAWSSTFNSTTNSARQAQKELKRTILGFDEINKLNDTTNSGSSGGSGSSPYTNGYELMFEQLPIDSGFLGFSNAIETALSNSMSRIEMIISGASLGLGAILAFSGVNIPLGIALMVAGAAGLTTLIALNWEDLSGSTLGIISTIEAAVSAAMLALGAILAFSSVDIPLGIALMAAGAATLVAAIATNWDSLSTDVTNIIKLIEGIAGGALLTIGAILAFSSVDIPLGIALMAAGAASLAAAVSLDWGWLQTKISEHLGAILLIGTLMTVIGAILLFSMANPGIGLALLIAGLATTVTAVVMNWDSIVETIKGVCNTIKEAVSTWWNNTVEWFKNIGETIWTTIKDGVTGAVEGVAEWVETTFNNIKQAVSDWWDGVVEWFSNLGGKIWETVRDGIGGAVKGIGSWIKEHVFKPFQNMWNWLFGKPAEDEEEYGLQAKLSYSIDDSAVGQSKDVNSILGDEEPSYTELRQMGLDFGQAIRDGIKDKMSGVASEIFNKIKEEWTHGERSLSMSVIASVKKGDEWDADAFKLARDFWQTREMSYARHELLVSVKQGDTWNDAAWSAANMGGATNVRFLKVSVSGESWDDKAWNAANMGGATVARFLKVAVSKAEWNNDAFAAARMLGEQVIRTVVARVRRSEVMWDANAWAAARMLGGQVVRTVVAATRKSVVTWDTVAWKAAQMLSGQVLKTVVAAVRKSEITWDNTAWSAAQKLGGQVLRTVVAAVRKSEVTWDRDAWLAAQKLGGQVLRTVVAATRKSEITWNSDAYTVARMLGGQVLRTVVAATRKSEVTWNNDAWTAARMLGGQILKTVVAATRKSEVTWNSDAWKAAQMLGGQVLKTVVAAIRKSEVTWDADAWQVVQTQNKTTTITVNVKMQKDGWTTVEQYMKDSFGSGAGSGDTVEFQVPLTLGTITKSIWDAWWNNTKKSWATAAHIVEVGVDAVKDWTGSLVDYLGISDEDIAVYVDALSQWGITNTPFLSYLGIGNKLSKNVGVDANKAWGTKSFLEYLGIDDLEANVKVSAQVSQRGGNIITVSPGGSNQWRLEVQKMGGVYSNGVWSDIPQYASGTLNAGSIFAAGEAGPELVGHIGGRTEVLNKSQLAATMYSAVQAAMAPASANFAAAATQMYKGADGMNGEDMETLMEMVRQTNDATMRQNELLREQNDYLRQLNDKDFTAEITTSGISRAQARANRRAGTTVIPVGT